MTMPWDKFFWSDYASDPALKLCSFAAQGLWMRMLCVAAEHEPAGYLAINGRGLGDDDLARVTGGGRDEVAGLIVELERNGVFSRDRRGWIYSRRMVRAARMRRQASEWGKKGGNPKLRKEKENSAGDKGGDKAPVGEEDKPQKPEARVHSVDKSTGADAPPLGDDFDPVKAIFDEGVRVLGKAGSSDKSARSLVGRWRREFGDDLVARAIASADSRGVSAPIEWIPRYLAARKEEKPRVGSEFVDMVLAEHGAGSR